MLYFYGSPASQWVKPSPWYKRMWWRFTFKLAKTIHRLAHKINRFAADELYG